ESADEAIKFAAESDDIIKLLEIALNRAKISLNNTPKLLPVLAQAGVVDSGGQGFAFILEGMLRIVHGDSIGTYSQTPDSIKEDTAQERVSQKWDNPYCTEFLLMDSQAEVPDIKASLETLGEDLVVVEWDELIKVHIHTNDPEQVLAMAHSYGKPANLKIDDTRKQHQHIIHNSLKTNGQDVSIITTAPGVGIKAILMNLGAEYVVMSEEARNPSVAELVKAIDSAFTDKVLLLPNESNIIPASLQAANMSQKDVKIIPSRNVSQGIAAFLAFRPRSDVSKNLENMELAMKSVKHGEIARAIRDAQYKNLVIKENDIIGLYDKEVKVTENHIDKAVLNLLKIMLEDKNEVITIFYGAEIEKSDAEGTLVEIEANFPDKEIELHYGGQSHCLYIISVE
ncbi:DAK2 domain-containing protein, partial [Candidatus Poribacteria bacterium]|nr:DAK2 domain-containing protein [Candidatus Poribacteria bacterium]